MEKYRPIIINTISKAKQKITSIKEAISPNKKNIEDIKDIIDRLKEIELDINSKQEWIKEKIDSLDLKLKDLGKKK